MRYAATRFVYLVVVLLAVTLLVSAMLDLLPGDPALVLIGDNATPEQIAIVHADLRLDEPIWIRWADWVSDAARGDLGTSYRNGRSISEQIGDRMFVTIQLVVGAQLVALTYALATSMLAILRPGGLVDRISANVSFLLLSTPSFVLGLVLVLVLASWVQLFPIVGYTPPSGGIFANLQSITLPVLALSADPAGVYQRVLRNDLGRTMEEPFVMMAWSKGLSSRRVVFRHALRPSLFSLVTVAGITTARLIGGSVVVETLFGLPGVARFLVDSINSRDLIAVQGTVAVVGIGYVVINSGIDLVYGFLNPRVRHGHG